MISDPLYAAEASNSLNELRSLFFPEAFEMVQEIEEKLLSLDQDEDASGSLANVFRLAHNLKGNAMMVDFMDLGHLTHLFENLLTEVKGRPSQASFEDISLLLRCTDSVKSLMKGLEKDPHFRSDTTELEKCLLEHLENPQSSAGVATPTDNRLAQVQPTQVEETIRVRMSRVNELIDYLDELVANHALLSMSNDNLSENVSKGLVRLSEIITQIRSTALTFRLIPVKSLFQKAQRTVRDISQSLGKEVRFITHGESLELDKDIIDLISDPIIHLIRNSLDHGIESKEVRVAAGKDPIGKIEISVFQDDGNVVFEVADDGHGLDHQKILKKAIEKNLIPSDSKLSNDEIGKLIFLPGFSTNDAVNEISGRGVGMDVVKSAVEDRAGGVVEIKSTLGKGSVFRLRLPPGIFLIDGAVLRN